MAQCLRYLDSLPSFQRYKDLILEAMNPQPGEVTADLGYGLGLDAARIRNETLITSTDRKRLGSGGN
jgi:hypothetical protein